MTQDTKDRSALDTHHIVDRVVEILVWFKAIQA